MGAGASSCYGEHIWVRRQTEMRTDAYDSMRILLSPLRVKNKGGAKG